MQDSTIACAVRMTTLCSPCLNAALYFCLYF
jgi:hypothetical protein